MVPCTNYFVYHFRATAEHCGAVIQNQLFDYNNSIKQKLYRTTLWKYFSNIIENFTTPPGFSTHLGERLTVSTHSTVRQAYNPNYIWTHASSIIQRAKLQQWWRTFADVSAEGINPSCKANYPTRGLSRLVLLYRWKLCCKLLLKTPPSATVRCYPPLPLAMAWYWYLELVHLNKTLLCIRCTLNLIDTYKTRYNCKDIWPQSLNPSIKHYWITVTQSVVAVRGSFR